MSSSSCAVCSKPTALFNYGVPSCNACKMFFRRALTCHKTITCRNNGKCILIDSFECRYCRFQQCLRAGMRSDLIDEHRLSRELNGLSGVIRFLSDLDISRETNVAKFRFPEDLTLDQLLHGSVSFVPRPTNMKYLCYDWGYSEQIFVINFIRKFDFMSKLTPSDSVIFLKSTFFKWYCFSLAWRNFNQNRDVLQFSDGVDIFPTGTTALGLFSPDLLSKIRCRIIGKFRELKMSRDEYLLVGAALFCNPAITGLSAHARSLITSQQRVFASTLLQHCLITYQQAGPSRFSDLLSLCTVSNECFQDVEQYYLLAQMYYPLTQLRKLYYDLFKFRF